MISINNIRCEFQSNPLGLDNTVPIFSYEIFSQQSSVFQQSYRIMIASSKDNLTKGIYDKWDSNFVNSNETINIKYEGEPLSSFDICYYQISIVTNKSEQNIVSKISNFGIGMQKPEDWVAKWICLPNDNNPRHIDVDKRYGIPASYFSKMFETTKPVRHARLFATALGLYDFNINSVKISDTAFTPGWTDYNKTIQYQTYNVTSLLTSGTNAIGAVLGEGWYSGSVGPWGRNLYGTQPSLLAQLYIIYEDNTVEIIGTNDSWLTTTGPILASDIIMGEYFDARVFPANWQNATILQAVTKDSNSPSGGKIIAQIGSSVKDKLSKIPTTVKKDINGNWIFDMDQNMVGQTLIKFNEPAGTIVKMRFGEMLNQDGTLYTENLRSALQTDYYICGGFGEELFRQHFTFHGFRYVEISGITHEPKIEDLEGVVIYSDLEDTGEFECSNQMINQLYSNIKWGHRGNFLDVPTDCPQRDERLGWSGDSQVFARTATYNMDCQAFFHRYLYNMLDAQDTNGGFTDIVPRVRDANNNLQLSAGVTAWGDAGIIIPWTCYLQYGDKRILSDNYHAMKRHMECLKNMSDNLIRPDWGYGDWLSIDDDTDKRLMGTSYFAYVSDLMVKISTILDLKIDSNYYNNLSSNIRAAYTKVFPIESHTSQTSLVLALRFNMLSHNLIKIATDMLFQKIQSRNNHLSTGFVGVSYLLPTLTDIGMTNLAYTLFTNTTYPSWGYSVVNGATTIWERWNSYTIENGFGDVGMNSFNHYAYGSVGEWMFKYAAGIDVDEKNPGYKNIVIKPHFDATLSFINASYHSIRGKIVVNWVYTSSVCIDVHVEIPANTTADIILPGKNITVQSGVYEYNINL